MTWGGAPAIWAAVLMFAAVAVAVTVGWELG